MSGSAIGDLTALGRPRWRGQPGRLEVWYLTFTDTATGMGGWVHVEAVAPTNGSALHGKGWIALFPADGPPLLERFGPAPMAGGDGETWFSLAPASDLFGPRDSARVEPSGEGVAVSLVTEAVTGDLRITGTAPGLCTFPRALWDREILPGAQVVPLPHGTVSGTIRWGERQIEVDGIGGLAHIYGHGSAQRWGWLHATLDDALGGADGGEARGAVLEIVTATARRATLRRVPPLAMVQLRLPGTDDWPANPALAAPRFRTRLRGDGFSVRGSAGGRQLEVDVRLPPERTLALRYVDPDGSTATCSNSERATAEITVRDGAGERRWLVDGTAHAEVGSRPATSTSR